MKQVKWLVLFLVALAGSNSALAHHSVAGEYGGAADPCTYIEGEVVEVNWTNPHVSMAIKTTAGHYEPGTVVWANSHPTHIALSESGMNASSVAVGDHVKMFGWQHLRGMPLFHMRAVQVNDGPMQSILAFADMWDIVRGNTDNGIEWALSLEGKSPGRMGPEMISMLKDLGYLGEDGNFSWNGQDPL